MARVRRTCPSPMETTMSKTRWMLLSSVFLLAFAGNTLSQPAPKESAVSAQ